MVRGTACLALSTPCQADSTDLQDLSAANKAHSTACWKPKKAFVALLSTASKALKNSKISRPSTNFSLHASSKDFKARSTAVKALSAADQASSAAIKSRTGSKYSLPGFNYSLHVSKCSLQSFKCSLQGSE